MSIFGSNRRSKNSRTNVQTLKNDLAKISQIRDETFSYSRRGTRNDLNFDTCQLHKIYFEYNISRVLNNFKWSVKLFVNRILCVNKVIFFFYHESARLHLGKYKSFLLNIFQTVSDFYIYTHPLFVENKSTLNFQMKAFDLNN